MKILVVLLSFFSVFSVAEPIDFSRFKMVDLSHSFDKETVYWPTASSGFELHRDAYGMTKGGYFYSANSFSTPEHGGTHLDAPIHFSEQGWRLDDIPLDRLLGTAIVINVSAKVSRAPDYRLTVADIEAFEASHGLIEPDTMVLMRTDYSQYWPDAARYLGSDKPGDASDLHFPSYGEAAARLLIEQRKVKAIGVDTASIDYGPSKDFVVHRIAAAHNVLGFENLSHLEELSPVGVTLIALPMKIGGGSGGPLRVVALVPK
ncbi:MAG: cyclase family protein [Halioglobus sp.]